MDEGYWDDVESDDPQNFTDGEYLRPRKNLGLVTFGANYGYEIPMVKLDMTKGYFGMSMLLGGGIGMAFLVGDVDVWTHHQGKEAYKWVLDGDDPEGTKKLPRVLPMVDVNASLRFNIYDRVILRVEGGLHSMLYYGLSLGVRF